MRIIYDANDNLVKAKNVKRATDGVFVTGLTGTVQLIDEDGANVGSAYAFSEFAAGEYHATIPSSLNLATYTDKGGPGVLRAVVSLTGAGTAKGTYTVYVKERDDSS